MTGVDCLGDRAAENITRIAGISWTILGEV